MTLPLTFCCYEVFLDFRVNIGVRAAKSEFLVVLSADAVPANNRWLEKLLQPFADPRVAGVYGRHVPRSGVTPSLLDRLRMHLRYGTDRRIQMDNSNNLFSSANSALRRSLWEQHNFDERLEEAEDYEWGRWAQRSGYHIIYEPEAAVEHTHGEQYGRVQFLARILRLTLLRWEIDNQFRILTRAIRFLTMRRHISTLVIEGTNVRRPAEAEPVYLSDLPEPKLIRVAKVQTAVDPEIKKKPCSCGGTLRYETFPFSTEWNDHTRTYRRLEVGEVQGYKCDQPGCAKIDFPAPIIREMEWHIDRARDTLSLKQKLEGRIKGYSSGV